MKILAIGNSFSVDAMEYLYPVLKDMGDENIVLGNLYIGGCPLERHLANSITGDEVYIYYKNTDGFWRERSSTSLLFGIRDEEWDIITFQQASHDSGLPDTYAPLDKLVAFVRSNVKNNNVLFMWHMTWAYQSDSSHPAFTRYNCNQMTMYNSIMNAVNTRILPTGYFKTVIPSGVAIQNARAEFGDTLTRDGFHLSIPLGRYIAALTWGAVLLGKSPCDVKYIPDNISISDDKIADAKYAVLKSVGSF